VNGELTEKIEIKRSIRQGCPLSMLLFAIAIEPLAIKIKQNDNIEGITIPNQMTQIKLFKHADDCTAITTNLNSYDYLINEFRLFEFSLSRPRPLESDILILMVLVFRNKNVCT